METNAAQIDGKTQASRLGSIDGLWGALPLVLSFGAEKIFGTENQVFTIWLFNIAMENGPLIDDFPIKPSIYKGFSMAGTAGTHVFEILSTMSTMSTMSIQFQGSPVRCSSRSGRMFRNARFSVVVMGSTLRSWTKTRSTGNLAVE